MTDGMRGRLISASFARDVLPRLVGADPRFSRIHAALLKWNDARDRSLGPASSVRAIADVAVVPLLHLLGYQIATRIDDAAACCMAARTPEGAALAAVVVAWNSPLDAAHRISVREGIAGDTRWCICSNGRSIRLVDAARTWSRNFLEFDCDALADDLETAAPFWSLLRAESLAGSDPALDRAVELSFRHGLAVCRSLGNGVREALRLVLQALADSESRRRPGTPLPALFEQSLTVLYRVLFLLFAEARGLVPVWHPIYRDRYTIDAIVNVLLDGRRYPGLWDALRAISRLAHAGCRAGGLEVTAFNGRLFSPAHTPSAERGRIDDQAMSRAVLALSTTEARPGCARIAYRDLDVEQLGSIYENVLDYEPRREAQQISLVHTGEARKASGAFYTPRGMTDYLVRRTLAPLVAGRTAEQILDLRIVDPAMGSGAFLVAACRYLAGAAEAALVRDGVWTHGDVTAEDRIGLRRDVAQRCLFGADLNPMAVQLARLSLWLATLASDKPLTFLDHHLVAGDSLVGAGIDDVLRQPPGAHGRRHRHSTPVLFDADGLTDAMRHLVTARVELALQRDDDARVVREKELRLAALRSPGNTAERWRAWCDLWCACWFWDDDRPPGRKLYGDLCGRLAAGDTALSPAVADGWLQHAASIAGHRRFLHWTLEFPEVFFDANGRRSPAGGFDAVIGNPPWDMMRADSGAAGDRDARRAEARRLMDFVRDGGIYGASRRSHANRYQLFVERALHLVKPAGRIGMVLPSGLAIDAGSGALRRMLFDCAEVDSLVGLDNRAGIFPIHRGLRFLLVTATAGRPTERVACRFGVRDPAELDAVGESKADLRAFPIQVARGLLERLSGEDDLAIPELATPADLRLVERIVSTVPALEAPDGWHVRFGRELNATDDRAAFVAASGRPDARPVVEGKQVGPFRVAVENSQYELADGRLSGRLPRRARLAYRDVASATNRLTLIAAMIPARAVTTHTLFCLRTPMTLARQLVLCAILNSFVANYLVRLRVNTHVTTAIVGRLPAPIVHEGSPEFQRIAGLSRALIDGGMAVEEAPEYAELQARVAQLYGLDGSEFAHVLSTFPLVPAVTRDTVRRRFDEVNGR